ncbi:hypothetical protein [Lysinibacillus xylanilyticus]|uniref:hypothetical protein n=1 Tax=Lysinibacillus xylanilyticus TaxID=582475 RepID=UPI003D051F06
MRRTFEIILCIFAGVFLFGIIAIAFQVIGEDSPNKATIIGGILSMIGGAIGALSAYLIARMQLTKQLELQDEKERKRILLEIKMKKAEEVLEILHQTKRSLFELHGLLTKFKLDVTTYFNNNSKLEYNADELLNNSIVDKLEESRDEFANTYEKTYKFKSYFIELINNIEKCNSQYSKEYSRKIDFLLYQLKYSGFIITNGNITNGDMNRSLTYVFNEIDSNFDFLKEQINDQIESFEMELSEIYTDFQQNKESL